MFEAQRSFQQGNKRTKEFILAKTMMVMVLVFLTLNIPRLILGVVEVTELSAVENCYELGHDYFMLKRTYIFDFLARLLVILNSSVNFLIYCLVGSEFRAKLISCLGLRRTMLRTRENLSMIRTETGLLGEPSCDRVASSMTNRKTTLTTELYLNTCPSTLSSVLDLCEDENISVSKV